jgi:regulatory protein
MKKNDISGQAGKTDEFKKILQRAAAICSRREQSSGQIGLKLKEWGISEEWSKRILELLVEQRFVDDKRFARLYVKEKFRLNRWGRVKIMHALRQHGIDEGTIKKAMEEIDEDAYYQTCFELIKAKSRTLKEKNQFSRKGKLLRYAAGRGFETDLVYQILNSGDLG